MWKQPLNWVLIRLLFSCKTTQQIWQECKKYSNQAKSIFSLKMWCGKKKAGTRFFCFQRFTTWEPSIARQYLLFSLTFFLLLVVMKFRFKNKFSTPLEYFKPLCIAGNNKLIQTHLLVLYLLPFNPRVISVTITIWRQDFFFSETSSVLQNNLKNNFPSLSAECKFEMKCLLISRIIPIIFFVCNSFRTLCWSCIPYCMYVEELVLPLSCGFLVKLSHKLRYDMGSLGVWLFQLSLQ